jgi:tripartite-type tricarboxylate transporter receptor subunit TctC
VPALPDVPTIAESGLPGYEAILWHGLIAPRNVPKAIVDRTNEVLNKALRTKDMEERLAGDGVAPAGGTPDQFHARIRNDVALWAKVVKKAGIKVE